MFNYKYDPNFHSHGMKTLKKVKRNMLFQFNPAAQIKRRKKVGEPKHRGSFCPEQVSQIQLKYSLFYLVTFNLYFDYIQFSVQLLTFMKFSSRKRNEWKCNYWCNTRRTFILIRLEFRHQAYGSF